MNGAKYIKQTYLIVKTSSSITHSLTMVEKKESNPLFDCDLDGSAVNTTAINSDTAALLNADFRAS